MLRFWPCRVLWAQLLVLGAVLPLASAAQSPGAPLPDAVTETASQHVMLCRPRGRCFIPEPDDPLFVGDVIDVFETGRVAFQVAGTGRAVLSGPGRLRVTRDPGGGIALALLGGRLKAEPRGGRSLLIRLDRLRCTLAGGGAVLDRQGGTGPRGITIIANGAGTLRCQPRRGEAFQVPPATLVEFRGSVPLAQRPVARSPTTPQR
ncbi:MAG: hypothetical protein IT557_00110 [Alphaproteobacteria bacterium]|nr:hypothetical protein [Alphaproteobacteria bacterium]